MPRDSFCLLPRSCNPLAATMFSGALLAFGLRFRIDLPLGYGVAARGSVGIVAARQDLFGLDLALGHLLECVFQMFRLG